MDFVKYEIANTRTSKRKIPVRENTIKNTVTKPQAVQGKKIFEEDQTSPIYGREIGSEKKAIEFTKETILNGIIFSEILGKPKSRRTGR